MKYFISIAVLSLSLLGFPQDFHYQSAVNPVEKKAYYKILISPELTSKIKSDFSDLRIFDEQNLEVPYIYSREQSVSEKDLFKAYEIVSLEHIRNRHYTRIIIRNAERTEINNLVLKVKNADVRKQLKLNASYDRESWYALKDNYFYNSIQNSQSTSEIRVLNFPLSDYEYYEILIEDYFDKPINILEAGYYNRVQENGKYTQIQLPPFSKSDSLKKTLIAIPTQNQIIDKIHFGISHPKYFLRHAQVFTKHTHKSKKRTYESRNIISNIELISNSSNAFLFNKIKADTLYIEIENKDDKALSIDKINCYQLNSYLTAELAPQQKYRLLFSDVKTQKAQYDLKYFKDSIPNNIKLVKHGNIQKIKADKDEASNNINIKNYWLWLIIIVVVLLLAYVSYKMINDNKLKNED